MPSDFPDPFATVDKAAQAVIELELEAGIAGAADRARGGVFGHDISSETPFGSKALAEESRDARRYEHEAAGRRTRPIYFGVLDPCMRRRLIAANRAVDAERHRVAHASVARARSALDAAVRKGGDLPVPEFVGAGLSAGSVWAAYTWAGIGAALALLAGFAAFMPGATLQLIRRRDLAIRAAEQELLQAEENAEAVYSLSPAFSASEERSGEPDPKD